MITVVEIKKKADRMYSPFLKATLVGETFFPKVLRSDKSLSDDFVVMSKEISALISGSKDRRGFGYLVRSRPVKTRNHGVQDIPESIVFESQGDYLQFIGKVNEFNLFVEKSRVTTESIPQLASWMQRNPISVVNNLDKWQDLLKVCNWFLSDYEPDRFYIRELPIAIHTKFIEDNKAILRILLDELIPEKLNANESVFEKRFRLKYAQQEIRFRYLKPTGATYNDLSVPLNEFIDHPITCQKIFIVENKMNFLTFPEVEDGLAIWGQGFAIENLKLAGWLTNKDIYYWSDLDVQGFQMLSQLRVNFPGAKSFLMERNLLDLFADFIVTGTPSKVNIHGTLNEEENSIYNILKSRNLRLEQERIPQWYVVEEIGKILK
ncbi:MAG: hypothetical protein K8H85_00395 [Cyclobacteriaceae bacterium]|nr:hypothetical protein [Cyclobacteriaceae bacterium]